MHSHQSTGRGVGVMTEKRVPETSATQSQMSRREEEIQVPVVLSSRSLKRHRERSLFPRRCLLKHLHSPFPATVFALE